jgi:hypothetical protein
MLVEYFKCHPADKSYNLAHQRYWREYHEVEGNYNIYHNFHLLKPSEQTQQYASANSLKPFQQWLYLYDNNTILHGPFNFATINGRKTRDRIDTEDWNKLISKMRGIRIISSTPIHAYSLFTMIIDFTSKEMMMKQQIGWQLYSTTIILQYKQYILGGGSKPTMFQNGTI